MKDIAQLSQLFVSPEGDDRWSGQLPEPNTTGTDGPFATLERARDAVRKLKVGGTLPCPVRVALRGGVYELKRPFTLGPEDSGSPAPTSNWNTVLGPRRHVTYAAYPGERPVLSGGRRITGWKPTKVHGRAAWVTQLPDVARGRWFFTQLWVNGRRAQRPRLPRTGLFRIEKLLGRVLFAGDIQKSLFTGQDRFRFRRGDLKAWRNPRDIEFVGLHYWIESRIPFRSIDPRTREARLQWKSRMRLTDDFHPTGAQYYVENVFEELREPGQWYLDRPTGRLTYIPRPGERIETAEVFAPRLRQLVILQGNANTGKAVEHVAFDGLTFSHSEWVPGAEAREATPQAACHIPGALSFRHARHCDVRNCGITHVGSYGIELLDGSTDVSISHNTITDLAGGGVKIWHSSDPKQQIRWSSDQSYLRSCRRIIVADNEIGDGGIRFHQSVGVLIGRCSANQVLHNHIHDFNYTGVSVGWMWGYAEGHACGNLIEYNHIHHIGRGMLSDMGAIYTLGVQPGTRLRYNLIHDVESRGYGGWGIYPDEGSSHILIESNLVHRTKSGGVSQHYGQDNIIRNNIFALGREFQVGRSRIESHHSFRFTRNIVYGANGGVTLGGNWKSLNATLDRNLYFDRSRKPLRFGTRTFAEWQRLGADAHSIVADPLFVDAARGDFRLKPGSPAKKIGFVPFDLSTVGPRK